MASEKKYGLFLPKSLKKQDNLKIANVFGDDEDEDEKQDKGFKGISSKYGATANKKSVIKRQTQLDIDKALAEDPTVFEYDNVYEEMVGHKEEKKVKKAVDSKPRYIEQLLKASEKRKKDDERRQERKIQKEREAEGEEFADKEVFVTSAYKKKMEERQAEEEHERREAEREAKLDVTKQQDLTGFYRYILNETTKDVKEQKDSDADKKEPLDTGNKKVMVKDEPDSDHPSLPKSSGENRKRRHSSSSERSKSPIARKQKAVTRKRADTDSDSDDHRRAKKSHSSSSRSHDKGSQREIKDQEKRNRDSYSDEGVDKLGEKASKSKRSRHSSDSDQSNSENEFRVKHKQMLSKGESQREKNSKQDGGSERKNKKKDGKSERMDKKKKADIDVNEDADDSVDSDSSDDNEVVGPARPPVEEVEEEEKVQKKEPVKSRYARRNTEEDIKAARARYLTRKLARERLRGTD